jgi:hypothetical protein
LERAIKNVNLVAIIAQALIVHQAILALSVIATLRDDAPIDVLAFVVFGKLSILLASLAELDFTFGLPRKRVSTLAHKLLLLLEGHKHALLRST